MSDRDTNNRSNSIGSRPSPVKNTSNLEEFRARQKKAQLDAMMAATPWGQPVLAPYVAWVVRKARVVHEVKDFGGDSRWDRCSIVSNDEDWCSRYVIPGRTVKILIDDEKDEDEFAYLLLDLGEDCPSTAPILVEAGAASFDSYGRLEIVEAGGASFAGCCPSEAAISEKLRELAEASPGVSILASFMDWLNEALGAATALELAPG